MSHAPSAMLCQYHYNPLDRLVSRSPAGQIAEHSFYLGNRLATQVQGPVRRSWLQGAGQLLAQQRSEAGATHCTLIATDAQGSVLHGLGNARRQAYAYAAYGKRHPDVDPLHLPGYNREVPDPLTGHYLLGNGHRAFNPVLMRFNSPDSLSPFGKGGLNAYAYCAGDPLSQVDLGGRFPARAQGNIGEPSPRKLKMAELVKQRKEFQKEREGIELLASGPLDKSKRKSFVAMAQSEIDELWEEIKAAPEGPGNPATDARLKALYGDVQIVSEWLNDRRGQYQKLEMEIAVDLANMRLEEMELSPKNKTAAAAKTLKWNEHVRKYSASSSHEVTEPGREVDRIRR